MQEIAIEPGAASRRWRGVVLVAGAAAVWSIAGIITRLTATDVWTTLFWRSIFAAAFLCCYIAVKEQGDWRAVLKRFGWPSLGIAVTFAAAMISFITALYETTVANVLFIQATAPFFAALGAWLLMRERVLIRTLIAISLALLGVGIMVSDSAASGRLLGDLLSVMVAVCLGLFGGHHCRLSALSGLADDGSAMRRMPDHCSRHRTTCKSHTGVVERSHAVCHLRNLPDGPRARHVFGGGAANSRGGSGPCFSPGNCPGANWGLAGSR
jgi:uncharacterized membrane protein